MNVEEIIRLIFSFIGGGVVVGIFEWIRQISADKKARKYGNLNKQLINLYGPLYFFTSQNEVMFRLNGEFGEAHRIEYENTNWSSDKNTRESITEESRITIELGNAYIAVIIENNDKILELLRENYHFIHADDIKIFQEFITDYTRSKKEINEQLFLQVKELICYVI